MKDLSRWPLVYVTGSIFVMFFYAVGIAGRFFDYHPGAVLGIFIVLALPLVLLVFKVPSAPIWNIVSQWVGAGSILAILVGAMFSTNEARLKEVGVIIATIALASASWATIWTIYFLRKKRTKGF